MNKKILILLFALSGFTALVYEIVWARSLQLIFGSTIYAVSTILTTFFVGFALGSYLFRNLADRTEKPLGLFALLELGIGVYGLGIIWLFKIITPVYLALDALILQFLLLFIILIIPATLFGGLWPVVNRLYVGLNNTGKDIGNLYSGNSLGSSLGPLVAGFILIPLLGIKATSILAASLNIFIGIGIFILIYYKENRGNENGN